MTPVQNAVTAVAASSAATLRMFRSGPVAEIVLSRPERLNAINRAVLRGLREAVDYVDSDSRVRVVVMRGEGRAFSAGGDLEEVAGLVHDRRAFSQFLDEWHSTFASIESLRVPVIAAVHGFALAGGFELVQVCDLVVIGDQSRIGDQHANFGLFPAGGSTQRLPRQVNRRTATWLLLSGESLSAESAMSHGLVNRVVPETEVRAAAMEMAGVIAGRSASGTAAIKAALRLGADRDVVSAIAGERQIALNQMASADAQKGFAAFRARTVPNFADDTEGEECN
jgi:enoyl-CoA hydratase/carnithine racemase